MMALAAIAGPVPARRILIACGGYGQDRDGAGLRLAYVTPGTLVLTPRLDRLMPSAGIELQRLVKA
jgi:hypothetical protein